MENLPQVPGGGGTSAALSQEEVTWTYDLWNGITLEFIITDGLITQITTGGKDRGGCRPRSRDCSWGTPTSSCSGSADIPNLRIIRPLPEGELCEQKPRPLHVPEQQARGITIAMVPSELTLK